MCHALFSVCYDGAFKRLCTSRQYAYSAILWDCAALTNGAHMEVHTQCAAGVMLLSLYVYCYCVAIAVGGLQCSKWCSTNEGSACHNSLLMS